MIKPDFWIKQFGINGGIVPFDFDNVNPASYDVTLGNEWISPTKGDEKIISDSFILYPKEVVLATTQEYINLPRNVVCDLKLKSTIGRLWINHSLSGWIDCGFHGQITLELQNIGVIPQTLKSGIRIAQLVFMGMEAEPEIAYDQSINSHYNEQIGVTKAYKNVLD